MAAAPPDRFTPQQRRYWAFQKVQRPPLPAVRDRQWVRNPIDAFILAKLEAKGITPGAGADRITLLRRVSFDLIGLPPSPGEMDAFLSDRSPQAYEKAVDRLLASPHYGERWARHWLDLARYAETNGFKSDEIRPNVWRYRDYVIKAFNEDKPYDRFIKEQIAGDEMWPNDPDALVATAFNRHYPDESNAKNLMQRRQETLNDITDTVSSVFLGLSVACARCHDHKFDPILHADYYRLQAFFANVGPADFIPLWPPDRLQEHQTKRLAWEEKTRDIRGRIDAMLELRRKRKAAEFLKEYPPDVQTAIARSPSERTPLQWQIYYKAKPYIEAKDEDILPGLRGESKVLYENLRKELESFSDLYPGDIPKGSGIIDISRQAPPTHVLAVGVYDAPQEEVQPGYLTILDPGAAKITPPARIESTGRRTALAGWLADPANPLPARVMVNRIWHHHFGEGIVATPSDFGMMGSRPTHPELLDWLAAEFVEKGWSMKYLHRLMVTSSAYRQSSHYRGSAAKENPRNTLLWRFPRQRLEGEVIRDSVLLAAGLLNTTIGGPSVFPRLPAGMTDPNGIWKVHPSPADENRRSVYIFVERNLRYPMLAALDMPDTHESCARRQTTTTAPQALTFLNSELVLEWAQAFAGQVLRAAGSGLSAQVEQAYRRAYSRSPSGTEKDTVLTFFKDQRAIVAARLAAGEKLAVPEFVPAGVDPAHAAALVDFCHMLLNSNEFVYRN